MNQNSENAEAVYKTNVIIWAAILMSQFMFIFVLFMIKREMFNFNFSAPLLGENAVLILILAFMALSCVIISFVLKRKYYAQSAVKQNLEMVQNGLITALALCEAASLFGMVLAILDYQYFFAFFALGILATLAHFPKRDDFYAASFKN